MSDLPTLEALREQITRLETELAQLRPIEAAAREAYAFFAGRRPGFAPSYARDVICAAFEINTPRAQKQRAKRATQRRKISKLT